MNGRTQGTALSGSGGALRLQSTRDLADSTLDQRIRFGGRLRGKRILGKLAFVELEDQDGSVQVVVTQQHAIEIVARLPLSSALSVHGRVKRKAATPRAQADASAPGQFEILADDIAVESCDQTARLVPAGRSEDSVPRQMERRQALLTREIRSTLFRAGFVELPPPDQMHYAEMQSALRLLHGGVRESDGEIPCLPPLRDATQAAASAGFDRFFFLFDGSSPLAGLVHVCACFPDDSEFKSLAQAIREAAHLHGGSAQKERGAGTAGQAAGFDSPALRWTAPQAVYAPPCPDDGGTRRIGPGFYCAASEEQEAEALARRQLLILGEAIVGDYAPLLTLRQPAQRRAAAVAADSAGEAFVLERLTRSLSPGLPPVASLSMALPLLLQGQPPAADPQDGAEQALPIPACIWRPSWSSAPAALATRVGHVHGAIEDLQSAAQMALMEQVERLEIERERGESTARPLPPPMERSASIDDIEAMLKNFSLSREQAEILVQMLAVIEPADTHYTPNQLFQTVWSLLGSASVKHIVANDEARDFTFDVLLRQRIVTEKRQLLYIYPATIGHLKQVFRSPRCAMPEEYQDLLAGLRTLLAKRPTEFSTAVGAAAAMGADWLEGGMQQRLSLMLRAADERLASPLFFRVFNVLHADAMLLRAFKKAIQRLGDEVFRNQAFHSSTLKFRLMREAGALGGPVERLLASGTPEQIGAEVVYFLFHPVTVDFDELAQGLAAIPDCTRHVSAAGLHRMGETWVPEAQCFRYFVGHQSTRDMLRFYLTKNTPSFFAKSSAGICTAGNAELYLESGHLHLNIIQEASFRVIGNVQLYVLPMPEERVLMIRGLNPSGAYVNATNAAGIVDAVLDIAQTLAALNGFSHVYIAEQLGLWNADSSRAEIRAVLNTKYLAFPLVQFTVPVRLYNYFGKDLWVRKGHLCWVAHGNANLPPQEHAALPLVKASA